MKNVIGAFGGLVLLLTVAPLQGVVLSIEPVSQTVLPGSTVNANLVVSGLGNHAAPSLGTFDVNVSFNDGLLGLSNVSFGTLLGDVSLGEATTTVDTSVAGVVQLFELSLLEADSTTCVFCIPPFLVDLQPSSFTLATLTFAALGAGSSPLSISVNALGDAFGNSLSTDVQNGNVTIQQNGVEVSEPSAIVLIAIGLAGLFAASLKKRA